MSTVFLKARAGFTLTELLIAATIMSVLGAAVTGLFVAQSKYFDQQQKLQFARSVARSATNILVSELRMLDKDSGLTAASSSSITMRVPYALGLVCNTAGVLTVSMIPTDSLTYAQATYAGYAYRQRASGMYRYTATTTTPVTGVTATCTAAGITTVAGGRVVELAPTTAGLPTATPILLYQTIRYYFANSGLVSGRKGLFREVTGGTSEEIVAPFDTSAKFRYFNIDHDSAQNGAPPNLSNISGIELVLDAISERRNKDGTFTKAPLRTAVFFKNRR